MCLIVFAWRPDSDCPLLLAANRDEFHSRASAPMQWWEDAPQVLAGRDLQASGTWLGVGRSGRFAAVTNIRDPNAIAATAPRSRGDLTRAFLDSDVPAREYLDGVASRVSEYLGFNLLLGDRQGLWYLHGSGTRTPQARMLKPGIYGLSNAALDVPWPKVQRARQRLADLTSRGGPAHPSLRALRSTVGDRSLAPREQLNALGLDGEMAQRLSGQFIVTADYGTRCCTTLRWMREKTGGSESIEIAEQRFDAAGTPEGEDSFAFELT